MSARTVLTAAGTGPAVLTLAVVAGTSGRRASQPPSHAASAPATSEEQRLDLPDKPWDTDRHNSAMISRARALIAEGFGAECDGLHLNDVSDRTLIRFTSGLSHLSKRVGPCCVEWRLTRFVAKPARSFVKYTFDIPLAQALGEETLLDWHKWPDCMPPGVIDIRSRRCRV